ncbi:MAG: M20/M25/M40 family metallo-hydrolase [Ignavibacteriaceae bacterium]
MDQSRLIEIFLEAAAINALSFNEKPVADYIKKFLNKFPIDITEDDSFKKSDSNSGNIICRIGNGGNFLLTAHMDTARPTKELRPVIHKDRIESSGDTVLGVDNRAGVAILLYVLETIFKERLPVKDFTIAFITCEETTLSGSKNLGVNGEIKNCFVFDSSYRPGNFINTACGSLGFKIIIKGRASHSGLAPEKGINSLAAACKAVSNIQLGKIDEETTVNIGKFICDSAVNVIPEETELEGEIRSFQNRKIKSKMNEIEKIFNNAAKEVGASVEIVTNWDFKPYQISEDSEVFKETVNALNKVGLTPIPRKSLGGSDANSFNERGMQAVNLGIGAQNPHSNNEFILIKDLVNSAEIALEIVGKK